MIELVPLFFVIFYFVPFMVAAARDHDSHIAILIVNALVGWTIIGWAACLAWAIITPPRRTVPTTLPDHLRRIQ